MNNKGKYNIGKIAFYSSVVLLSLGTGIGLKLSGSLNKINNEKKYTYERIDATLEEKDGEETYSVPEGYTLMIDEDGSYYGIRVESNIKKNKQKTLGR